VAAPRRAAGGIAMTRDSRDSVLGALRGAVRRDGDDAAARQAVESRLQRHPRGTVPARCDRDREVLAGLFVEQATAVDATVARVTGPADVPAAVADYLKAGNLPSTVRMAPDEALDSYPWGRVPTLEIERGRARPEDAATVTGAFAAVAETGTLMLASGPDSPTTLNFLPEAHIVVLHKDRLVGAYEEAWDRLRATGRMPRAVNLVTGPSRTADIEQTLQLGIHGPRRLHIVLVEGDSTAAESDG